MPRVTSDVWRYRGLVADFARRELKGKYKGSVLGSFWALVNPLATLAIYSLVFGFFLRFPSRRSPATARCRASRSTCSPALVVWNFFLAIATGRWPR